MALPTSNLAPFFGDYVSNMLGNAQGLATLPFQPFEGDRFAGPSSLQQQAFSGIGGLTTSPFFGQAGNMLGQAGNMAGAGSGYTPTQFNAPGYQAQNATASGYNPATMQASGYNAVNAAASGYNPATMQASSYNAQQMSAPGGIGNLLDASDANTVQSFMNPYTQGVTDIARRQAQDAFNQQSMARNAAAQRAGAFGGSRHGVTDAMASNDLNTQLNDIQLKGGDAAFRQAMDAINAQRSTDLNRQQFNNQMQFNTGLQNMNAMNQAGQFNAGLGQQASMSNQAALNQAGQFGAQASNVANLQNALAANQAGQFNAGLGQQASMSNQAALNQAGQFGAQASNVANLQNALAANQAAQFGAGQNLDAQRLGDMSRQAAAGFQNQGIQNLLSAGTGLANLGTAQTGAQQNIFNQMLGAGATQQGFAQQPLDFGFQQFQQSLAYPYEQLNFQRNMLQGLPLNVSQGQQSNALLEGLMGAGGIYDLLFGNRNNSAPGTQP
jgi:hypothetical protein